MKEVYKYDWLIVGAGLFGATFANLLKKDGKKVLVIDKRSHIGGNCYIQNRDNIPVHVYGPHIFHTNDNSIWEYVNQFVDFNRFTNCPKARYIDKKNNIDEMFSLPFNMNTFYELFKTSTPEKAKHIINKEIEEARNKIGHEPTNLEEQALLLVGKTIYKYLIKNYTERQWGRKCTDLDPNIIKRLPLRYSYNNNYFNDKYQGVADYTLMIQKMLDGCEVALNSNYFCYKEQYDNLAEHVLYTGPIDAYFNYHFQPLEWRSVYWKTYSTDPDISQGNAVINNVGPDNDYTRTIEHKYFNMMDENYLIKKNWFSEEYSVEWKPNCGFDPCYPIYNESTKFQLIQYKTLADAEKKTIFGGRLADFKYMDMDDTIKAAMELYYTITNK